MKYGKITVADLVNAVKGNPKDFPKGLDTPIVTGDFECNCTHGSHEISLIAPDGTIKENTLCLGYEMHENIYEY